MSKFISALDSEHKKLRIILSQLAINKIHKQKCKDWINKLLEWNKALYEEKANVLNLSSHKQKHDFKLKLQRLENLVCELLDKLQLKVSDN